MTSKFELAVEENPGKSLSIKMLIDGVPFGNAFVDLVELKESALASGAYDLQTCGCGTPQCANFWEPIFVQHSGDVVRWEFDARYHPIAMDDAEKLEFSMTRYEFDRKQYTTEIREKFSWLRSHPRRDSIGPHGFKATIFDEEFPEPLSPQIPFNNGDTIVVGYIGEYQQPWVWIEEKPDVYPRQLLPTGSMWAKYGYWSLMWDNQLYDLGPCAYRKEGAFQLRSDVSVSECNQEVESLARDIQGFWRDVVRVQWDKTMDSSPQSFIRCDLAAKI